MKSIKNGHINIIISNLENQTYIEIQDTGHGMSQDQIDQILKANIFFEHDNETDDLKNQIGIGLYLTIKILEHQNKKNYFIIESE